MSVEIEPSELTFNRPFTSEVHELLNLKNTSMSPIAFKVKTTAPKQYCVRPNSGRIEPGQDVDVTVVLQAMKTEPPLDAKCRDKFLVQSAVINGENEYAGVAAVLETTDKTQLREKKIRVTWSRDPSGDKSVLATPKREQQSNNVNSPNTAPPMPFSSPKDMQTTIHQIQPAEVNSDPIAHEPPVIDPVTSSPASVSVKEKSTVADEVSGLRQRKAQEPSLSEKPAPIPGTPAAPELAPAVKTDLPVDTPEASSQTLASPHRNVTEGVPVKIVAILCMLSFLLAYFFF
ncbi:phosphatidylinositol-binding protein scs2 [Ceratocystis pirilliformis]|uniref:Phosphatidylinositol-binding protein scs2 n=1 Tax=Ceratocystis pirilliformis TaxID=259994 RepID=A0ABR3Z6Z7_9PEZI